MARNKIRMTVFSRFLLFMLIVVPSAYFGISYYKGEDGLKNLKEMVGMETAPSASENNASTYEPPTPAEINSEVARLQDELAEKEKRVKEIYLENETLKEQLKEKTEELEEVKQQLEKIKAAMGQ